MGHECPYVPGYWCPLNGCDYMCLKEVMEINQEEPEEEEKKKGSGDG